MTYRRTCQTSSCSCVGEATRTAACAFELCTYPQKSCCTGFKADTYQGKIQCGPLVGQKTTVFLCIIKFFSRKRQLQILLVPV